MERDGTSIAVLCRTWERAMRIEALHSDSPFGRGEAVARSSAGTRKFDDLLNTTVSALTRHTVKPGDTLSEIVQDRLKGLGRNPTTGEIYRGVERVARANGIADPNFIEAGATLDLSSLDGEARAGGSIPVQGARAEYSTDWRVVPAAVTRGILNGPGRVSSPFGMRHDPFEGILKHHHGVDVAAKAATTIRTPMPGSVIFSGRKGGYGNVVVIRHSNGLETLYGHNDKNLVREGDRVIPGMAIALVGSTGRSTGPHVHFEVRRGGRAIDPTPYLHRRRAHTVIPGRSI